MKTLKIASVFFLLSFVLIHFIRIPVFNVQYVHADDSDSLNLDEAGTGQAPPDAPPGTPAIEKPGIPNVTSFKDFCDFINAVLNVIAEMASIVAVLFIIWSGFLFIKAQGNPEQLNQAKKVFWTTIVGTAIIVGASVMTKIIINTVNTISPSIGGAGNIICPKNAGSNGGNSSGGNTSGGGTPGESGGGTGGESGGGTGGESGGGTGGESGGGTGGESGGGVIDSTGQNPG